MSGEGIEAAFLEEEYLLLVSAIMLVCLDRRIQILDYMLTQREFDVQIPG